MLKPAILYKEELIKKFAEQLYTDDYFLYNGYPNANGIPDIKAEDEVYQYAILDNNKVVGFFTYKSWSAADAVSNFGLFSFERGNFTVVLDVYCKMKELVKTYRRVEWRMIGGNPAKKTYDLFCDKFNGYRVRLHDVCKDNHGEYHDEYIYEIVKQTD